ncbi:MAG: hypothetical protein IIB55_08690, partial [Planctomycetes bacterium]|nr:hypothetical protein [Planctomycetota bacterium]
MVALMAFLWWSNSHGVGRYTSSRRMVHNDNYKMNVTFYAYDEDGNATDDVVSSGTIAFSKASLELDAFEAQWRLRVPQSAKTGPLAESGCLELLNGPGVLDAIQGDEYWWLDVQPHLADY